MAVRRSAAVRPGNVVWPAPTASAAWASLDAEPRQAVPVGEGHHGAMAGPAEGGRIERLQAVGVEARVGVGEEAPKGEALGAERVRDERVGRHGQAAGIVHGGDGRPQGAIRTDRLLDEEGEQMAAAGRDLLADDHFERQAAADGDRPGRQGGVDPLVIGDGDDVELRVDRGPEDFLDAGGPVRREGMDVEVRPTEPVRHGRPSGARSGQIGKKTAHHWSGAAAIARSNARASAARKPAARSRRVPVPGTATSSRWPA